MAIVDVTVNASVISPQPSEVRAQPPRHVIHRGADGSSTVSKRTKGWTVTLTWGSQEAYTTAMSAIRTALGSNAEGTLAWTDPNSTTETINIVHEGEIEYTITVNKHYGRFSHTFYES